VIQLASFNEEGSGELVSSLVVAASLSTCRYYILGDYWAGPYAQVPVIQRVDPSYVCGDGNEKWTVANGPHAFEAHRFEVYYYTESGARYKESWMERTAHPGNAWTANPFYIRWHATVPALSPNGPVPSQIYSTDNTSFQPNYKTNPAYLGETYGAGCNVGDRIVWAQIYSQSSNPAGLFCAATSSKSTTTDI
jgi:hypothetical protein